MTERRPRGRPRAFNDKTEQNRIQSLDRAMMILENLGEAGALSLTELATRTDQSPATAYRVLTTLEARGIVELDPVSQSWAVGAGAYRIGSSFLRRTNIVERARPIMRQLMEATGETANLGVENGDQVLFVSQVETNASIRAFFPPGTQSPMHASGIGKALLAHLPTDRMRRMTGRSLESFTTQTLTDPATLGADLERIRARGYSVDDEERTIGMRCVAAPIFNATGEAIAGISISGPVGRVSEAQVEALGRQVRAAAQALSAAMGAG